jgi:cell division protein FtsB
MLSLFKNTQIYSKFRSHRIVAQLHDVRSLGLIVFAAIALLVTWSGAKAIQSNYKLEQQISDLQQQDDLQQLENDNQQLKNQYYNTPQYLELAARQNFGLAAPGETELLVPKSVAMAYVKGLNKVTADASDTTNLSSEASKHQPLYQRDLQAWVDFFLHRSTG